MKTPCMFCGDTASRQLIQLYDADGNDNHYTFALCQNCNSGSIINAPDDEALAGYYSSDYYGESDGKFNRLLQYVFDFNARKRAASIYRLLQSSHEARILDIGCGRGQLIACLEDMGCRCTGIELENPGKPVRASLDIRTGDILQRQLDQQSFDAIVIWHVLEHLRDPVQVVDYARQLLKPGGLLVLAVPNLASWQARWFGAHWFHHDAPRHLHGLSRQGLATMLEQHGFRVECVSTFDSIQNSYGFIQSVLNRLFPRRPNALYALLKSGQRRGNIVELLLWCMPALLLVTPALIELFTSQLSGKGACCTMYARTSQSQNAPIASE